MGFEPGTSCFVIHYAVQLYTHGRGTTPYPGGFGFGFGFSLSSLLALIDFMVQFIVLNYITPYYWRDQPQQCLNKVCIADQFYRVSLLLLQPQSSWVGI